MNAYVVMVRERVTDLAKMEVYSQMAARAREGHTLVRYGALRALEGAHPDGVVILSFPTMADAQRWYDSDAYQQARAHRLQGADYQVFIVEGLSTTENRP